MFFRKPQVVVCAVCGKSIETKERRFVEKNRLTGAVHHTHTNCRPSERVANKHASS